MIDIATEELIRLEDVPKLACLRHCPPSSRTVRRWVNVGLKGHRLEVVTRGGTRCTTLIALQRFMESLNQPATGARPPTTKQQAQAHDRAMAALRRAGMA